MALSFQRQGIFGRRNPMPDYRSPWETPGFGDSIIDRQAGIEPVNATPDAMPIGVKEITKKPGFFGQGGAGRAIAGTIGDFLLQQSGMDPIYLPNVLQQRDAEERARMAQQQRMQSREDKMWEWQNKPKDVNPYRWEDNAGNLLEIDANGQPRVVYKDPTPKVTYMNVDNADGTKTVYPVVNGQIVTGGGQRPQVGAIIPDPRKQGGQSGAPTGGFRGGI